MVNKSAQGMKLKISPASPFKKNAQMKNKKIFQLPNKKNGQMKIQQMSFMLLAVFLFFALVGMIILTIKFSGLRQDATDLKDKNAMLFVTKLASSPEFSCGNAFDTRKTDCIDEDKVMMLKANMGANAGVYANFWGVSNIEIRRIYPKNNGTECTLLNYPKCDTIILINKPILGFDHSNFVALCRKEKYNDEVVNICEMAKVIVRYEEA